MVAQEYDLLGPFVPDLPDGEHIRVVAIVACLCLRFQRFLVGQAFQFLGVDLMTERHPRQLIKPLARAFQVVPPVDRLEFQPLVRAILVRVQQNPNDATPGNLAVANDILDFRVSGARRQSRS